MTIIENISISCSCNEKEAQGYLDDEIRNLRDLQDLDDLRPDDIGAACANLGLENDFEIYFINALAG